MSASNHHNMSSCLIQSFIRTYSCLTLPMKGPQRSVIHVHKFVLVIPSLKPNQLIASVNGKFVWCDICSRELLIMRETPVSSCEKNFLLEVTKLAPKYKTRSSWLNSALRDDEDVYWACIGHSEAVAVGNWWYWVSRGPFYIAQSGDLEGCHACLTDSLTHNFER